MQFEKDFFCDVENTSGEPPLLWRGKGGGVALRQQSRPQIRNVLLMSYFH